MLIHTFIFAIISLFVIFMINICLKIEKLKTKTIGVNKKKYPNAGNIFKYFKTALYNVYFVFIHLLRMFRLNIGNCF